MGEIDGGYLRRGRRPRPRPGRGRPPVQHREAADLDQDAAPADTRRARQRTAGRGRRGAGVRRQARRHQPGRQAGAQAAARRDDHRRQAHAPQTGRSERASRSASARRCRDDPAALGLGQHAIRLAKGGASYIGQSSPYWYDAPQFHELLSASSATRPCARWSRASTAALADGRARSSPPPVSAARPVMRSMRLEPRGSCAQARAVAKPVNPKRLGAIGPEAFPGYAYAIADGEATFGASPLEAVIPFVVEAWAARPRREQSNARLGQRQPHAGRRRFHPPARQERPRPVRLRAAPTPSPSRRRGAASRSGSTS